MFLNYQQFISYSNNSVLTENCEKTNFELQNYENIPIYNRRNIDTHVSIY
jgi:hypothetical protein